MIIDFYINLFLFLAIAFDVLLIFLILFKSPKKEIFLTFAASTLSVGMWTLGIVMFRLTDNYSAALFWNREFIFTSGLIASTFLHFSLLLTESRLNIFKRVLLHIPNLFILVAVFMPGPLIKDIVYRSWGKESILGYLYPLFGFYFSAYVIYALYLIFKTFRKAAGLYRTQLLYVLLATILTSIVGTYFNLYLILMGNYKYIWVGPYNSLILVTIIAYAITKTELMDIKVIIGRNTAYSLVGILLIASFVLLNSVVWLQPVLVVANALLALFWAWGAHRLREFIQTPVDKWISWYKPEELLNSIALKLVPVMDRQEAFETIANELKNTIKIKSIEIFTGDEIPKTKEIKRSGKNLEIPFSSTQGIEGTIKLGEKESEDSYDEKDLRLFQTLQVQILAILDRVQAYETIKRSFEATQKKLYDTERLLARSEKIASMANLIQEYNHEIRTPLGIVRGETERLTDTPRDATYLEWFKGLALTQLDRTIDIVESTSRIGSPREHQEIELDLNKIIESAISYFPINGVRLIKELKPIPLIRGDKEDLQTVFINLIKNSVESISGGGDLKISTYPGVEDNEPVVYAEVSDTGAGIPEENMEKIFEPFFSTHVTKGRGLGLSIVFRIIREHLGKIEVKSKVGVGSTFKIQLKALKK
ncbi:MAG: ATP-binding protein [Candidatus Margulisbacteria bacterium]|nr:ATP-binding protein [Candidatus Margulisiibacteriota bacterium]